MNKTHKKLLRDLRSSKGLFLAVTLIIFLAVAFFGAMFMAYQNLNDSYNYSYEQLGFADFTVMVDHDATEALEQLQAVEVIDAVTGRMNTDFALTLPGAQSQKVLARVISLPASESDRVNVVNDVLVDSGGYFSDDGNLEVLLEKNFAEHHEIEPGQIASLTVGEETIPFEVAGIATSPEYIFPAKSRQEIIVSADVWGVVFITENVRTSLLNYPMNEFCFLIADGADMETVIAEVKGVLNPYDVMDVVPQEDQPSYAGLQMDLDQFATLAEVFPLLFIIVGAMATYILLTRIVYNQRSQIGLMRAVGHSRRQVMFHYLGFALFIGIIGSVLGTIAGYLLSEGITHLYAGLINLPFTTTEPQWMAMGGGFFLGLLPCFISGLMPAWAASRIPPAEAMRAPAPTAGRKLLLERMFPFLNRLSSLWKIPIRNIFRNRRRSLYTVIGVTFGVSLILISAVMIDSMRELMDFMYEDVQRYDARVDFAEPQSSDIVNEIKGWRGVKSVEPILEVQTRMKFEEEEYTTLLRALPSDGKLRGLYSKSGDSISVSYDGILLSEGLRNTLDVQQGNILDLDMESPYSDARLEVAGFIKEPMGSFGYVPLEQVQAELTGGMDDISGLLVEVESEFEDTFREMAYGLKSAPSVELTSETKEGMDNMMEAGIVMLWIMLLFGAVLALAIVFTTVTVNILERRREIATMRTLGESKGNIAAMITIENLILGAAGLIPGIALGYAIALFFFSLFQGDMFTMDLVILPGTYILTVGIIIGIMLISQIPSIRSINRLNLAQVTKEQSS